MKFNNFIELLLVLKPVFYDKHPFPCNLQQIKKLNIHFTDKNVGTDYFSVCYHLLKRNDDMYIIINEPNKPLHNIGKPSETVNKIVAKHPIIDSAESFHEISEGKYVDATNLSQNIDFNISSKHRNEKLLENKSGSEINLDEPLFHEVADNAINQLIVSIENTNSLQAKRKELFTTSKKEEPITSFNDVIISKI